ncbi:MAG: hypothetical protein J5918_01790 [Prevotella sp.]|jgi:hypothetical protein|nr:hypothetical protein [Prevotella sp.]MBR1621776.1 hypothetical protein [Prevotella sp.]
MKKVTYLFVLAVMLTATAIMFSSCGEDDGVMPLPQTSNVSFKVDNLSEDLLTFYDVTVTYKDLNGVSHTDKIDGHSWEYKEGDGPSDAPISCTAVAELKSEYKVPEKNNFEISYHYSVHYYKPSTTAKSENPEITTLTFKIEDMQDFFSKHNKIVIMNVNR